MNNKTVVCPICGTKNPHIKIHASKLTVYDCSSCKTYFALKRKIKTNHDKDYYKSFSLNEYFSYYKRFRIKFFRQNWKIIQKIKPAGKAIDFGASFGWFIECAPKTWAVTGIEQSKQAIEYAKGKKLNVVTESVLKNKYAYYDLITLWNVFEHLQDPKTHLKLFKQSLKEDGLLVLSVPNRDGLINRLAYLLAILGIYFPLYSLFQVESSSPHLFHYNAESLSNFLETHGFRVFAIRNQPIVDVKSINKRIELESKMSWGLRPILALGVAATYYLSNFLNLSDEIVIYAVKDLNIASLSLSNKDK